MSAREMGDRMRRTTLIASSVVMLKSILVRFLSDATALPKAKTERFG